MIAVYGEEEHQQDIRDLLIAFFPGEEVTRDETQRGSCHVACLWRREGGMEHLQLLVTEAGELSADFPLDPDHRTAKNELKRQLYGMLVRLTGRKLPWGTLTGIRPTRMLLTALEEGKTEDEIRRRMRETYLLSEEKLELAMAVASREHGLLQTLHPRTGYSLYVGIPFCPTTCLYCSFTSYPIGLWKARTGEYLDALCREMDYVAEKTGGEAPETVYIGGGTPTALTAEELHRLLGEIEARFDLNGVKEFTVEAGRPDSITRDKLEVLARHGISRISINPQTMKQSTLDLIGRLHSVAEVKEKFHMARELGMRNINMDLIMGLPEENAGDVRHTMEEIRKLAPESVTVHSLAIKRAARLKVHREDYQDLRIQNTQEMLDIAAKACGDMGLAPYYLYRQKNMAGNFENVGYAKPGTECLYNVLIMEECQTILACGAGTSTKFIFPDKGGNPEQRNIERCFNPKDVTTYLGHLDECIARKEKLFARREMCGR